MDENRANSSQLSIGKAVWLIFLPLAVGFQFAWFFYFSSRPGEFWSAPWTVYLPSGKMGIELVLYGIMLWFTLSRTKAKHALSRIITIVFLSAVLVVTAVGCVAAFPWGK